MKKNLNLAQIGRQFGVSAATVSNVLNNKGKVSADLAEKIIAFAGAAGYRPSLLAQSLKGHSKIVGICLRGSLAEPWYVSVLDGAQRELRSHGFYTCVVAGETAPEAVREALDFFAQLKVAAVVLGPLGFRHEYEELKSALAAIRHVTLFDTIEALPLSRVEMNIRQAAIEAVDYLVSCGHRRIGFAGLGENEIRFPDLPTRYSGFCAAMRAWQLPIRPEWLLPSMQTVAEAEAALQGVRRLSEVPTAFFCLSDRAALLMLKALSNLNWRVPDEISVIGVDNLPAAELSVPGLSSMGFDCDRYSSFIAESVMRGIEKIPAPELYYRSLAPKLVVRQSVAIRPVAEKNKTLDEKRSF